MNVIIGLLSYLYYKQMSDVIWERNKEATQQTLLRLESSVDRMIKDIDRISAQILFDPDISGFFAAEDPVTDDSYATFVRLKKLSGLLQTFNGPALTAKRIIVFNVNGDYIDYGLNWDLHDDFRSRIREATWIEPTFAEGGELVLVPPRPTEWQTTGELVFSAARRMNRYTIIEVQQPYSLLEQVATEGVASSASASIYLYDDAGRIFYPYGQDRLPFDPGDAKALSSGAEIRRSDTGEASVVELAHSAYTGLTIALVQPTDALLQPIRRLHLISFAIIGAAELLALLLSYAIAKTITSPIVRLQRFVRKVDLDNAPPTMAPQSFTYSQEVNELYETFVKMTRGLHRSMNEVIDLQSRESVAQMQALQAQMNPHFLFNTLTTIGRLAEESANPLVAQMCYKLMHMMRYSAQSISEPVPLREEWRHAETYLELMNMRYEHQFRYEINVDSAVCGESVPKLLLQPFLENCFAHGFRTVEPPWRIVVDIGREPAGRGLAAWHIAIRDNGGGFAPGALASIREVIDTLHEGRRPEPRHVAARGIGGVGMANTLIRCAAHWQERVRFDVRNLPEGAQLTIRIRSLEESDLCSVS